MKTLMPNISLTDLDLFLRVARFKSLRECARQVDMSPGAVSKSIKRLEQRVGKTLLRRSASGILMTSDGNELISVAEKILNLAEPITAITSKIKKVEKVWSVGSLSFISSRLMTKLLDPICLKRANTRFRIVEFSHNQLVAHGLNGAFEMALHIGPLEWTRIWSSHELGKMKWCLYCNINHPLAKLKTVKTAEVVKFPFVMATGWGPQGFIRGEDHCPIPWGIRFPGHEATTAETALEIVTYTQHLAFVPEILAKRSVENGLIKKVVVTSWPIIEKNIYLSVRDDLVSNSLLQIVKALVQEQL